VDGGGLGWLIFDKETVGFVLFGLEMVFWKFFWEVVLDGQGRFEV
jgi:hypothetical protein